MALINKISDIAEAVRERSGYTGGLTLEDMAIEIKAIPYPVVEEIEIKQNGTYSVPDGVDGYSAVEVNVQPKLEKIEVTSNGTFTPPVGIDGYNSINVEVPIPEPVVEEITIIENGTYEPPEGVDGYSPIIVDIPTGGGGGELPEKLLHFTGDCKQKFYGLSWNWVIDEYGDRITTEKINSGQSMFDSNTTLTKIPFELNFIGGVNLNQIFNGCIRLTEIAPIHLNADQPFQYASRMFSQCEELIEIPEMENFYSTQNQATLNYTFSGCIQFTEIPEYIGDFYSRITPATTGNSNTYYGTFNNCKLLRNLDNIPYFPGILNSNAFGYFVNNCYNLSGFLFKYADGTVPQAKWKNQTIDLSTVGWFGSTVNLWSPLKNKLGTQVTDDATYEAVMETDENWWTTNLYYSRYNLASALMTIENLPDCSAYGTNTIKFKGEAGLNTYEGAINALTEEEIAVATAKGWTVTLV